MRTKNLIAVVVCLGVLFGCGKSGTEVPGEGSAEVSGNTVKVKSESAEGKYSLQVGDRSEIPADFPADVYIHKPSRVIMAMAVSEGYMASLVTQEDRARVRDEYGKRMRESGWALKTEASMDGSDMLVFEKGERKASVMMAPAENGLQVNVTVSRSK